MKYKSAAARVYQSVIYDLKVEIEEQFEWKKITEIKIKLKKTYLHQNNLTVEQYPDQNLADE